MFSSPLHDYSHVVKSFTNEKKNKREKNKRNTYRKNRILTETFPSLHLPAQTRKAVKRNETDTRSYGCVHAACLPLFLFSRFSFSFGVLLPFLLPYSTTASCSFFGQKRVCARAHAIGHRTTLNEIANGHFRLYTRTRLSSGKNLILECLNETNVSCQHFLPPINRFEGVKHVQKTFR